MTVPDTDPLSNSFFTKTEDNYLTHLGRDGGLVSKSGLTLATPWTVACQAPLFMEFSSQEYWNGLPFPPPGDLPNSGIEHASPAVADGFFTLSHLGSPLITIFIPGRN